MPKSERLRCSGAVVRLTHIKIDTYPYDAGTVASDKIITLLLVPSVQRRCQLTPPSLKVKRQPKAASPIAISIFRQPPSVSICILKQNQSWKATHAIWARRLCNPVNVDLAYVHPLHTNSRGAANTLPFDWHASHSSPPSSENCSRTTSCSNHPVLQTFTRPFMDDSPLDYFIFAMLRPVSSGFRTKRVNGLQLNRRSRG